MIPGLFDINDMRSARNDFQRGAVRQTVQASVDQVVVQVGILITADDQGRCTDLCQINQKIGSIHAEIFSASVRTRFAVVMPAA